MSNPVELDEESRKERIEFVMQLDRFISSRPSDSRDRAGWIPWAIRILFPEDRFVALAAKAAGDTAAAEAAHLGVFHGGSK